MPFSNGPPDSNSENDTQHQNRTDLITVTCELENERKKFKVKPSTKLQKIPNIFCEKGKSFIGIFDDILFTLYWNLTAGLTNTKGSPNRSNMEVN